MNLPAQYAWLTSEPGPKMILESLKIYGTHETPGTADNPVILSWAKELGISWYYHDSTPWCGLEMGVVAKRAGKVPPRDLLSAEAWTHFGTPVTIPMLGDVLIFVRDGGHHVTLYIGEDEKYYYCLGGNQSDMVNIVRIEKSRLLAARRPIYEKGQPSNVRRIFLSESGSVSTNEQ